MKRTIVFFAVLFLIVFFGKSTQAEEGGINREWSSQDAFYLAHREECKDLTYIFTADKNVSRYRNPEKKSALQGEIKKGERVFIIKTYQTAFENWGLVGMSHDLEGNIVYSDGWVKLSELEFVYDTTSFFFDHEKEYHFDLKELSSKNIKNIVKKEVIVWTYPNSGEIAFRLGAESYPMLSAVPLYEDKDGRYWMVVSADVYKKGTKWGNCSVCVSDPQNDSLPAYRPEPCTRPEQEGTMNFMVKLAAAAGIGLLIIAVIIFVRKRSRYLE